MHPQAAHQIEAEERLVGAAAGGMCDGAAGVNGSAFRADAVNSQARFDLNIPVHSTAPR